jgi:hypothetical protein
MNAKMVGILFLKDLFLIRKTLFAYLIAGIVSSAIACYPNESIAFVGFLLVITVTIAMGIHMMSELILEERKSHTLSFVMSLPVKVTEYSLAKISVVLVTYMIPWTAMLIGSMLLISLLPTVKNGILLPTMLVYVEMLASFTILLAAAVISESIGVTIGVMVAGNVFLNLFLMKLFNAPEIVETIKLDRLTWTPLMSQVALVEFVVILAAIAIALAVQTRKRNFI